MKFHHIGIATKNIDTTLNWIQKQFEVTKISEKIFDSNQNAYLQMVATIDVDIELISGEVVEKFIKKNVTYYHICYEVDNIENTIKNFNNSILISAPKEAFLFQNRKVAFLLTPIGIIELLSKN